MNGLSLLLSDQDLHFIVHVLMPDSRDMQRMVKTLRNDEEILRGMLLDKRLLSSLTEEANSFVRVSPHLFFTVLLEWVKKDIAQQNYTIERSRGQQMVVFDGRAVADLLKEARITAYLADLLVSFIRINSITISVRVKKEGWRKLRFSDFDVESLIRYSEMIEESQRFGPYKRIADICLFISGVFPEYIEAQKTVPSFGRARLGMFARWSREGIEKYGKLFYRAAAEQSATHLHELQEVLMKLSEHFILATKPLDVLTNRYLSFHKEKFFLQ
ncbi:MAG: hypothetical protein AMS17_05875 [Spirochaetes bacterium DG_61]|jgi:hypothetical protein|nr:MAG: hypothetical protein AMS17_05875 [Spirochaetes bacterium DG_61]